MTPSEIHQKLAAAFGDAILALDEGTLDPAVRVDAARIVDIARFLRDDPDCAFDTLRLLTATDRTDAFEVVWHLLSIAKRHTIVARTRLPHEDPRCPTLTGVYASADWYEREAWDLVGVTFDGHPDLRRILMPVDWVGHPLRRDYVQPDTYHGVPTTRKAVVEAGPVVPIPHQHVAKAADMHAGYMQLNMGPHHPATHGVINFLLDTDGEIMRRARPDVGYLHRGLEKLAELTPYPGTMPYTDRADYLGAMFENHAWALAVERLAGIEVPRRAEFCRVIASELNRLASHLVATGSLAMDMGAFTPFIHWLRERETINDLMERICGARLTYNYMRFGGVSNDIDAETIRRIGVWLDHFEPMIDEFNHLISENEIFIKRLVHQSVITKADALSWGIVGPNLRASGVPYDLRRDEPYSIYPELDFDVIVGTGVRGSVGDAYDRYWCRVLEMRESVKILRQCCERLPEGEIRGKAPRVVKPAANEVYARVEGPRGEAGFYVVSDGSDKPWRVRIRTGSFTAMSIIEHLSPGLMVADLVALIGSLDVIAPEVDR